MPALSLEEKEKENIDTMHKHSLHALTPSPPPQAQIGSIMVWLRGTLVTGCISWNKLEPEP